MPGWSLLLDVMATLGAAFLLGTLFERFRQSAVLGYVLAGVLLAPGAAGLIRSPEAVESLAEVGIALLLFTVGLEFSFKRLRRMGRIAVVGGLAQIGITGLAAFTVGRFLGYGTPSAFSIAAVIALSSTAVVVRVLREQNAMDAPHGRTAVAILLLQDLALVPLVLTMTVLGARSGPAPQWADLAPLLLDAGVTIAAFAIVLGVILPRAFMSRAMGRNRELPILLAIVTCVGAAFAAHALGVSPSLGAFLAGMVLAESAYADQIRVDIGPLRTVFVTLFFASVGMLADVGWILAHAGIVAGLAIALIVGKAGAAAISIRLSGQTILASIGAGLALANVGELSFVLLQLASGRGLLDDATAQALTSAAVVTLLASPFLVAVAPKIARKVATRVVPIRVLAEEERHPPRSSLTGHVVLVGFGEAGQSAAITLRDGGARVLVLEISPPLMKLAESLGFKTKLGDATQPEMLEAAQIGHASALVVSIPDDQTAGLIVAHARSLALHLKIVARARHSVFRGDLLAAGATIVVDEEELMGTNLGEGALAASPPEDPGVSLR